MARLVILLAIVLTGCASPSLKDRARSLGANMADLGKRVAKVVSPRASKVAANVDVRAVVVATADGAARDAMANQQPITLHKSVRRTRPAPAQRVEPTVTVDRVDASRPTQFVLRFQTDGGAARCEAYDTMESCTASCTNMQRPQMFDAKAPKVTCSCLEQDGGC